MIPMKKPLKHNLPGMKARLATLEHRRGELRKEIEDRDREIKEIDRDARILALAIEEAERPPEKKKDEKKPDSPAKVN